MVTLLSEAGADLNAQMDGNMTPLLIAASTPRAIARTQGNQKARSVLPKYEAVIQYLLGQGANIYAQDSTGQTALDYYNKDFLPSSSNSLTTSALFVRAAVVQNPNPQ